MKQESEREFTVSCEATAAVGFEVKCTAIDAEAAQEHVENILQELTAHFSQIVAGLMQAGPDAMAGYMAQSRVNGDAPPLMIARGVVSYATDDAFEVVDTWEGDSP